MELTEEEGKELDLLKGKQSELIAQAGISSSMDEIFNAQKTALENQDTGEWLKLEEEKRKTLRSAGIFKQYNSMDTRVLILEAKEVSEELPEVDWS